MGSMGAHCSLWMHVLVSSGDEHVSCCVLVWHMCVAGMKERARAGGCMCGVCVCVSKKNGRCRCRSNDNVTLFIGNALSAGVSQGCRLVSCVLLSYASGMQYSCMVRHSLHFACMLMRSCCGISHLWLGVLTTLCSLPYCMT